MGIEHEHLALADRHIAEGERIVAAQKKIIEQIRRDGAGDLGTALSTLDAFEETLKKFYLHRDHILRSIAELEQHRADGKPPKVAP